MHTGRFSSKSKLSIRSNLLFHPDVYIDMSIALNKYDIGFRSLATGSYLYMAYRYMALWFYPEVSDIETIYSLSTIMAFEFIMVHSGAFMSAFSGFKKGLIFLVLFYGLFAVGFNFAMPNNDIFFLYLFVVLNRMRFLFYEKKDDALTKAFLASGLRLLIYFFLVIPVVLLGDKISPMGLTPAFLDSANYNELKGNSSGVFIDTPQVAHCFGFLYYLILAGLDGWGAWKDWGKIRKQKS